MAIHTGVSRSRFSRNHGVERRADARILQVMTDPRPLKRSRLLRLLISVPIIAGLPLGLFVGCQSRLIYFPRPYAPGTTARWEADTGGKRIGFSTSQGGQRAFLQGNLDAPRNLWIVCGGNGTVALDWSDWLQTHGPREDAWLLVDFPGYGDCAGKPSPRTIRESLQKAVPKAMREVGLAGRPERLRFFGHSLGAAATLIAASEHGIQKGVMLAPFTSTMDMAKEVVGLPVGFLVWHRYDNRKRLDELERRGPGSVVIVHGAADEAIPSRMGAELASSHPGTCRFVEIPGARHNTIPESHPDALADALREIGR